MAAAKQSTLEPNKSDAAYKPLLDPETGESPRRDGFDANGIRVGAWEAELFGCCDHPVPNGFMSAFFPFISIAQISERMGALPYTHVLIGAFILYLLQWIGWIVASTSAASRGRRQILDLEANATFQAAMDLIASSSQETTVSSLESLSMLATGIFVWQLRIKVRERFQLPGSCAQDCCVSFCCQCCSIAQMATHVQSYKPGGCDFGPPNTLPAYTP
ncbi:hypothetical protein PINS_up002364 [Pythium insidiosum]|nr:hypothetical protein PINS_up002364 [Pythium insidiosum]